MNPLASFGRFVCAALLLSGLVVTAQPIITDADQVLGPVPVEEIPASGTFWFVQQHQPPLPWNPFPELPVYLFGTNGGHFLVDDSQVDYAALREAQAIDRALLQAEMQLGIVQMSSLPELPGGGGGAYDPGVTNLPVAYSYAAGSFYIELLRVTNGTAFVALHGTVADELYQVFSKETLTNGGWIPEGEPIIGQDSMTLTTFPILDRTNTLFLRAMTWQDSDGSGMPDWWQLNNFGHLGVDPYADPDGDGWVNMQEYQNGTYPMVPNTPPAPTGFQVKFNDTSGEVSLSWNSGPGMESGYVVERDSSIPQTFTLVGTQMSDIVSPTPSHPDWWGPEVFVRYRARADYNGLASAWTEWVDIQSPVSSSFAGGSEKTLFLVGGQGSSVFLALGSVPADAARVRLWRIHGLAHQLMESDEFDSMWEINLSEFKHGLYQLSAEMRATPQTGLDYDNYTWWAQVVTTAGPSKPVDLRMGATLSRVPFLDGRRHMKQNMSFVLRAANRYSGFLIFLSGTSGSLRLKYPTNYVFSSFFEMGQRLLFDDLPTMRKDELTPFRDNYIFRNFVYDPNDLNASNGVPLNVIDWDFNTQEAVLSFPPRHLYSGPTIKGSVIPDMLSTSASQWTYYYPLSDSSQLFDLASIGVSFSVPNYTLSSSARNIYGLPYKSIRAVGAVSSGWQTAVGTLIRRFGDPFYLYPETEQPDLRTEGYLFASIPSGFPHENGIVPCPGQPAFDPENVPTAPLIAGFGDPDYKVAGWAKQRLFNGYTNVVGFLGQYFEHALLCDSEGQATTNSAGVIGEYGNFFPTQPGRVALITMSDLDSGEHGTGVLHVIKLQMDVNHDGKMELGFGSPDNTSETMPLRFWVNNDFDRLHTVDFTDHEEDDLPTAGCPYMPRVATPDCAYLNETAQHVIPCNRDLEDYARLWIPGLSNILAAMPSTYTVKLTLIGDGAIRLFRAIEPDGNTNYLFDEVIASNQVNNSASLYVGLLSSSSPIVFTPVNLSGHFIWCGAARGNAELHLQVLDGTNTVADTACWISLKDIKEMYERWTVGDQGTNAPWSTARIAVEDLPSGTSDGFQYSYTSSDSETPYILHVHGWNMERWEKDRFGEAMFKRLYWQGYDGRFGIFRWPTLAGFPAVSGEGADLNHFDKSEYNAWRSGTALRKLLVNLHAKYPGAVRVSAHSMGNVVAGEALSTNSQLAAVYIAMQAAVPAGGYWMAAPFRAIPTSYFDGTTELYRFYPAFTPSRPYFNFVAGASDYVNFYNQSDWALNLWLTDQNLKPDDSLGYSFDLSTSTFLQFQGTSRQRTLTVPANTFELFAFSVEGQCWALGAQANVAGVFTTARQVDLDAVFAFGDAHKGHSAQFRSTNMKRALFWTTFSTRMGVK